MRSSKYLLQQPVLFIESIHWNIFSMPLTVFTFLSHSYHVLITLFLRLLEQIEIKKLHVYRETVCHSENKQHLGTVCVLRHGVYHVQSCTVTDNLKAQRVGT